VTIQMDKALPYCMVIKGGVLADWVFDSNTGLFTESLRFPFFFSPFFANTSGTFYQDELLNKICLNKVPSSVLSWLIRQTVGAVGRLRSKSWYYQYVYCRKPSKFQSRMTSTSGNPVEPRPSWDLGQLRNTNFSWALTFQKSWLLWWDLFAPLCLESRGNAHLSGDQVPEHKEWNVIWVGSCDLSKSLLLF
jgi:hypothetical protein